MLSVALRSTARVNAACFSTVDVRPYAVHLSAVGVAFRTTARVNAAYCSAVGIGVILPISPRLVPPFTVRLEQILPVLRPWV